MTDYCYQASWWFQNWKGMDIELKYCAKTSYGSMQVKLLKIVENRCFINSCYNLILVQTKRIHNTIQIKRLSKHCSFNYNLCHSFSFLFQNFIFIQKFILPAVTDLLLILCLFPRVWTSTEPLRLANFFLLWHIKFYFRNG